MPSQNSNANPIRRVRIWYALVLCIMVVFGVRLFYLQVIKHDHYRKLAQESQLKIYQIPAERGIIEAHDGSQTLPIVLNEILYTLFADPKFIKDAKTASEAVQKVIAGNADDYEKKMKADSRYQILAKKLSKEQKQKFDDLKLKGVGTREESHRTYPQGELAAQILGFVDDEGEGKYGIEQALQDDLKGTPGQLKAITDAAGVPLAANKDNVTTEPKPGKKAVLTIDLSMQQQLQDILKGGLDAVKSTSGSALIMDPSTGAVKAMANFPTYNPANFSTITDASVFNNTAISSPLEVGSVMKPLTMAAALDQKVVSMSTTYADPSRWTIDSHTITNIEEDGGPGTKSIADILQLSLNTGATWLLMQMGGGEVNEKARTRWYDYMFNHYRFGQTTGIEQGYEEKGSVPDPVNGFGLNIQFANTAFGQGMTATPLQMGAALASIINGGTYYRPRLLDELVDKDGKVEKKEPDILKAGVVSAEVSGNIRGLMQYVVEKNIYPKFRAGYNIGGKTGTAQIANPAGGYFADKYNGMYMGYVGGDRPEYVIVVRVNEPHGVKYAGSGAAQPIFINLVNMLINSSGVTQKTP